MGAQLSWESICLTSRGSQVRALLFPPHLARQFSWLERQPVTLEVRGSSPLRVAIFLKIQPLLYASVAQLVEQGTENPRVVGSIPTGGTICGFSSFGRASPCQGEGGGFEPRNPLQTKSAFLRRRIFCLYYSLFIIYSSSFIYAEEQGYGLCLCNTMAKPAIKQNDK